MDRRYLIRKGWESSPVYSTMMHREKQTGYVEFEKAVELQTQWELEEAHQSTRLEERKVKALETIADCLASGVLSKEIMRELREGAAFKGLIELERLLNPPLMGINVKIDPKMPPNTFEIRGGNVVKGVFEEKT